jgi:uncharacterized protein HemY
MRWFWKKEKKEEEKKLATQTKSTLENICKKYGKSELYSSLSRILPLDPRKLSTVKDVPPFYLGSLRLYEGNYGEARKCFEKAMEDPQFAHLMPYLKQILENLDIVAKIAREWWKEEGVYQK